MFAGAQRGDGPAAVQAVGQRVVDGINGGVGEQRVVAVVHRGDAVFGGKGRGAVAVARGDGGDLHAVQHAGRTDEGGRRDPRGAQHADAHCTHGGGTPCIVIASISGTATARTARDSPSS